MQRIPAIDPNFATGRTLELMDRIQQQTGLVTNMIRTMAVSPAVLQAYIDFEGALAKGTLSDKLREQIALTVAELNGCEYSLSLHYALGKLAGLSEEQIQDSRYGVSPDREIEATLQFARQIVMNQGRVSDADMSRLLHVGYDHEKIAEIAANVILAVFTSYFNSIAETIRDFAAAPDLVNIGDDTKSLGFQSNKTKN